MAQAKANEWMTRREAATYLRVSIRQLHRLRLPRTVVGARVRYSRTVIDDYYQQRMWTPPERKKKGGPVKPPHLTPYRRKAMTTKEVMDRLR